MSTFLNDLISLAKLQQKNYQGRWQEDYSAYWRMTNFILLLIALINFVGFSEEQRTRNISNEIAGVLHWQAI
jgi:hypothetical protein